jgi:hypothetical protein
MTDKQSNWLDMYAAVYAFYLSKQPIIDTTPVLAAAFASLNAKKAAIQLNAQGQTINTTGQAISKKNFRTILDTLSYGIMAPVSGWSYDQGNNELYANTKDPLSALQKIKDDTYPEYLRLRHQKITEVLPSLGPLNITAVMLAAWDTAIDDYEGIVSSPRLALTNKKVFTDNLPQLFSETNTFLKKVLDKLMVGLKATQPDIYSGYVLSREIIDRGTGSDSDTDHSDPHTGTVNSGQIVNVLNPTDHPEWVVGATLKLKNTTTGTVPAIPLNFYSANNAADGWSGLGWQLLPGQEIEVVITAAMFLPFFNVQNQAPNLQTYEINITMP